MSIFATAQECDLPEAHDPHPWEEIEGGQSLMHSCSGEGTIARQARWDANVPLIGALDAMREEIRAGRHFDPSRAPMPTSLPTTHEAEKRSAGEQLAFMGTDAQAWADEFMRINNIRTGTIAPPTAAIRDWLVSWFANAIETGRTAGYKEGHNAARAVDDQGIRLYHCPGCVWVEPHE